MTHTLGLQALDNANASASGNNNGGNSAESGGGGGGSYDTDANASASANASGPQGNGSQGFQDGDEAHVHYTVWITEAWRHFEWEEPSAALFWEMATMYYTLHVAARSIEVEEAEFPMHGEEDEQNGGHGAGFYGIQRTLSQTIPPILSCGSSASMDSNPDQNQLPKDKERDGGKDFGSSKRKDDKPSSNKYDVSPGSDRYATDGLSSPTNIHKRGGGGGGGGGSSSSVGNDKKNSQIHKASAASAKELPVWLVGVFLLLHCEEEAFWRNVSGEDEQRFDALMAKQRASSGVGDIWNSGLGGKGVDFGMLLMHPSLSSRAQFHAGRLDNSNCTAYLLRHLRKFLLLACVPHNADALVALYSLAMSDSRYDEEYLARRRQGSSGGGGSGSGSGRNNKKSSSSSAMSNPYATMEAAEITQRHEEEHGAFGLNIRMTVEDLERLNLVLQAPSGGLIDDPPLYISDVMPEEELAVYGGISIEVVENEIRRHLERELMHDHSQEEKDDVESVTKDMGKMRMNDKKDGGVGMEEKKHGDDGMHEEEEDYHKELTYTKVRGSTILLKPNPQSENTFKEHNDSNPNASLATKTGRLHDVHVSGCSDSHMYLLQPFEHATISACSGVTIVVGAVAGLLHVVDCERTTITSAARRVLVSNCYDVTHNIFTPSPPLLVGDNRNCKFAPYNTYYDGLREDLLATGLAGALVSPDNQIMNDPLYGPALQCASNKWKQPYELSKLSGVLSANMIAPRATSPIPGSSPGADDTFSTPGADDTVKIPTLVPASEFQIIFVPYLSETTKHRRAKQELIAEELTVQTSSSEDNASTLSGPPGGGIGSMYCHNLADVLQLSPFRLPKEYESRVMVKAERMKSLQTAMQTDLTPEQQKKFEEELNSGFRDWLVNSGNLRQVLDLVHLERKEA